LSAVYYAIDLFDTIELVPHRIDGKSAHERCRYGRVR